MFVRSIALALMLMPSLASSQQAVTPPPKPADSGPTLVDTMKFLEDKLNGMGEFQWTETNHFERGQTVINKIRYRLSNVHADVQTCSLSWHKSSIHFSDDPNTTVSGKFQFDERISFQIAREIQIKPYVVPDSTGTVNNDVQTVTTTVSSALFELTAKSDTVPDPPTILFYDDSLADRIAKAMTHAIELCGGGNKDPF